MAIGAITGAISAHQAGGSITKGLIFGAIVGGVTTMFAAGTVAMMNNIALASQGAISAMENAFITGIEFGIGGFGAGLISGYAGGAGTSGGMFRSALFGGAIGFAAGFGVGYSYQAGWQDVLHGNDSRAINKSYAQAKQALSDGNIAAYAQAAKELQQSNVSVPSDLPELMNFDGGFSLTKSGNGVWSQSWSEATEFESNVGYVRFEIPAKTTLTVSYCGNNIYSLSSNNPITFNQVTKDVLGYKLFNNTFTNIKVTCIYGSHFSYAEGNMTGPISLFKGANLWPRQQ